MSQRKARFVRLMEAAYAQTTDWLISALRDNTNPLKPLARVACLHVVAARYPDGAMPYIERKHQVRRLYGF